MPLTDSPELGEVVQNTEQVDSPGRGRTGGLRILLLIMILVFAGLYGVEWWQRTDMFKAKGSITGMVVDPSGNPVPDAEIFVSGVESWESVAQDGSFEFGNIPAGEREVVVVVTPGPANSEVTVPVVISDGEKIDLGRIIFEGSSAPVSGGDG